MLYWDFGNNQQIAIEAMSYISTACGLPSPACDRNGNQIPGSIGIEVWDIPWQRIDSGTWVAKRLPQEVIDKATQEQVNYFNTNFPNTVEEYNQAWSPKDE